MSVYCTSPATLRLETLDPAGEVTNSLDLMDAAGGYRVATLDVGFPTVRSVSAALPTRDGELDYTSLFGPRTVTVTGSVIPTGGGSRQRALAELAWWVQPRLRPRLVYAIDADSPPLWIGLRGSALTGPASNPYTSAFSVAWVAPDPVSRAMTTSTVTINPGATGVATNLGTYRAWPLLNIHGPCVDPAVTWITPAAGAVVFAGLTVAAGHYVSVNTNTQTVLLDGDPAASLYPLVDFTNTRWAGLEPGATTLGFTASASASPAQVDVVWADSSI